MVKMITFIVLMLMQIIHSKSLAHDELSFPNESQRKEIATHLLSGIESIDAITIELRNKTRKIDWNTYKSIMLQNITGASDWNALYRSIDNLHFGILNRHSYVLVENNIKSKVSNFARWPALELGYTWPEVTFFSIPNYKTIETVNSRKIEAIFEEFFNLYCNDVHKSGCLGLFSSYMKTGYFFSGEEEQLLVKYKDGSAEIVRKKRKTTDSKKASLDCATLYSALNVDLIFNGTQSCLYKSNDAYVLKIFYFGEWGTSYDDIYCEHVNEKGMCSDINEIKRITRNAPKKSLIIDLQNNEGGSENTPWIAALTQNGFKDNLVLYKNLPLLAKPKLRKSAFYGSDRAEKWYQNVIASNQNDTEFLPMRSDFCRGSEECEYRTIQSSSTPIQYSDLKLVINRRCVSSCDDFIWRTRQYANAKTYGQLSATDGAYARLNGYLFVSEQGHVTNIITGEGNTPSGGKGKLLVTYQIPISRTVDVNGEPLEGNAGILDHPFPIDKNNFEQLELDNLAKTLEL